jgi:hypothetical protein
MRKIHSGGARPNGSEGIFASRLQPFLDFVFLIKEHLNPRPALAVNLPLPSRERFGVSGHSSARDGVFSQDPKNNCSIYLEEWGVIFPVFLDKKGVTSASFTM